MILSTNIFVAVLNYQRIDDRALSNLKCAELSNGEVDLHKLRQELGFEIDSVAIIKKCNAVMVVVAYCDDLSFDYVKGRVLHSWDKLSKDGISQLKRDIKFYENIEALQFMAECAVGIHSVTVGDSQVLAQISDGLRKSLPSPKNPLGLIAEWISAIAEECRLKTGIFNGNTSLERIASDYIVQQIGKNKKIMLVGYGKSGKLIAKILNRENNRPLLIINRTPVNHKEDELKENVVYFSFDSFSPAALKDVGAIVIAIDNTTETNKLIQVLIDKLSEMNVIFIDLSTPPLLSGKIKKFIGIDALSEIAQKTIGVRKDAVSKARGLINQWISLIVDRINAVIAANYILEQKKHRFSLDSEKVNLIKMRGEMFQFLRKFLVQSEFLEVITPSIVGISTDPPKVDKGGTIDVDWMNGARAFLRQSNQLYKQICVASGIKKIYEIGPFWRKETNESYRHLQESIGLDIELQNPKSSQELYELACLIIKSVNDQLVDVFNLKNHLNIPDVKRIPVFSYHEAVDILRENGYPVTRGDDFGLVSESKLGQIAKKKFNCDILVIKDYPDTIKKFYTKQKQGGLTETFDIIVDGWELVSGAVRQTNGELIRKSMSLSDISIADYEFYISIVDGSIEHGGFCLGLDRLLAKILDKEMVSDAVPFPRTYKKLIP